MDDLDEYSEDDNNSDIMDELNIDDSNKAILYLNELKNAILSINDPQISHIDYDHNSRQKSKNIALSMFKLWNIWLDPDDECVEQITNLFHVIKPKNYIACRDIFTQKIMKRYLQYPNRNCLGMISKKMNEFALNEYGLDNYCDIGQIINKKLLPYIPILTHLMSDNKLNGDNIKLIQLLFIVSIIRGIPNIMNIFNGNEDNENIINFDIALIFNKEVMRKIKKSIQNKNDSIIQITNKKKIKTNSFFKQNNYYNKDNIYDHLFKDLMKKLNSLKENRKVGKYDLIRIYIDMNLGMFRSL